MFSFKIESKKSFFGLGSAVVCGFLSFTVICLCLLINGMTIFMLRCVFNFQTRLNEYFLAKLAKMLN